MGVYRAVAARPVSGGASFRRQPPQSVQPFVRVRYLADPRIRALNLTSGSLDFGIGGQGCVHAHTSLRCKSHMQLRDTSLLSSSLIHADKTKAVGGIELLLIGVALAVHIYLSRLKCSMVFG